MKKDLLTIKMKQENPEQATSYATVAKTEPPDRKVDPKEEVGNVNIQRSPRDPNKILIITGKQKFRDNIEIKRTFAKLFPLKSMHSLLLEVTHTWNSSQWKRPIIS